MDWLLCCSCNCRHIAIATFANFLVIYIIFDLCIVLFIFVGFILCSAYQEINISIELFDLHHEMESLHNLNKSLETLLAFVNEKLKVELDMYQVLEFDSSSLMWRGFNHVSGRNYVVIS